MTVFESHSLLSLHDRVCVALPYCHCMTVFVSLYKYDAVCVALASVRMLWCHFFRLTAKKRKKEKKSDLKSSIYRFIAAAEHTACCLNVLTFFMLPKGLDSSNVTEVCKHHSRFTRYIFCQHFFLVREKQNKQKLPGMPV